MIEEVAESLRKLRRKPQRARRLAILAVPLVTILGSLLILISHAATPTLPVLSLQLEDGALGPHASRGTNNTALGSQYITFGQDTPPNTMPVTQTYGAYYSYVTSLMSTTGSTGASADLTQHQPDISAVAALGGHSLMELGLQNTAIGGTLEIGWTVDKSLNGDVLPHLFVYHWVNNQTSCYNGCGFVSTSNTVKPGMPVTVGATGHYKIAYSGGNWNFYYDNTFFGYFPGKLWSGQYTTMDSLSIFGEVSTKGQTCVQMGNGRAGSQTNAAQISNVTLYGTTKPVNLYFIQTENSGYEYSWTTKTSFRLGGPGVCTGKTATPSLTSPTTPQSTQVLPPGGGIHNQVPSATR